MPETITVADSTGREFETELGADGKNPVSPNNPPAKAVAPDEPKQPKEKGIVDPKAPITPNNPAQEKSQGFISPDVRWLPDSNVTDNSPNEPKSNTIDISDEESLIGTADGYAETATGTYETEDGKIKAISADVAGGVEPIVADPKPTDHEHRESFTGTTGEGSDDPSTEEPAEEPAEDKVPAKSALKAEWVEYAKSQGATDADLKDDEGKDLTTEQIIDKYAPEQS
jgi:hypothetical protein